MTSYTSHVLNDEWNNISDHLKELHDNIPSSQSIDWNTSDEENDVAQNKGKNLIVRKCKAKRKFHDDISLTNIGIEAAKSPILKSKVAKPLSSFFKSSPGKVLNKKCIKNISPSGHANFDDNDNTFPCFNTSNSLSPILKTRHKKVFEKNYTTKSAIQIDDHHLKILEKKCNNNNNDDESLPMIFNSITSQNIENKVVESVSPIFKVNKVSQLSKTFSNQYFEKSDLIIKHEEESKLVILSCSSPNSYIDGQDILSKSPSIDTQKSEESLLGDFRNDLKRGSDWVKDIQEITPEKTDHNVLHHTSIAKEEFDSVKKKRKKNGFAQQLRRLISFWQSNIVMWNHQMSLVTANSAKSLSCSLSPVLDDSYLHKRITPANSHVSSSPDNVGLTKSSIKTRFSKRSLCSLFFKEDTLKDGVKLKQIHNRSPVTSCIRNLRESLESISSESPSPDIVQKTNFVVPKKHLCAQVIRVEWRTSTMISTVCRELDSCSHGLDNAEKEPIPNYYYIMFGKMNQKDIENGNTVKLFAPWQMLKMETSLYNFIFASYYIITNNENVRKESLKKAKIMTKIASWECSCTLGSHSIPSMCSGGCLHTFTSDLQNVQQNSLVSKSFITLKTESVFNSVRDSLSNSPKINRFWTIMEAIEQCGGLPDIPVSLTVRIRRMFIMRNTCNKEIAYYLILGQDPSGTFAVLEIPNRPLKSTLESLIGSGLNTTRTLTHLSVQQRIVRSQDPDLFSLIHSLQEAYCEALHNKPQIFSLLRDETRCLQSFCYKFVVNLGQTMDYKVAESDVVDIVLPHWTLKDAMMQKNGKRGIISVNILYFVHPNMYVKCKWEENSEITRLVVTNTDSFPNWINCNGTIMVSAVIEDVLILRGSIMIDKYSRIIKKKSEKLTIFMSDLLIITPPLTISSVVYDVVSVHGFIKRVNTDTAIFWEECNICGGFDLHSITKENIKCQTCLTENIAAVLKYSLEVELQTNSVEGGKTITAVKLFQTTIKNLLKGINICDRQYNLDDIINLEVGPLLCYIKAVEKKNEILKFLLLELPY